MIKHTQTIRRMLPTNCLRVFDHFVGSALKGLTHKGLPNTPVTPEMKSFENISILDVCVDAKYTSDPMTANVSAI